MHSLVHKKSEKKALSGTGTISQKKKDSQTAITFADHRPEALQMQKLKSILQNSPLSVQMNALQSVVNQSQMEQNISALYGTDATAPKQALDSAIIQGKLSTNDTIPLATLGFGNATDGGTIQLLSSKSSQNQIQSSVIQRFYCLEDNDIVWIDDSEYDPNVFEVIDRPPAMGNHPRYWGRNFYRRKHGDIEEGGIAAQAPLKSVMGSGLLAMSGEALNAASVVTSLLDALKIFQNVQEYLNSGQIPIKLGWYDVGVSVGLASAAIKQLIESYKISDRPQIQAGWLNLCAALASLGSSLLSIYGFGNPSTLGSIASLIFWAVAEIKQSGVAQRGGTQGGGLLKALGAVTLAVQKLLGASQPTDSVRRAALSVAGVAGSGSAMAGSIWAGATHGAHMVEQIRNRQQHRLLGPQQGYGSNATSNVDLNGFDWDESSSDSDSVYINMSGDEHAYDADDEHSDY